jgi:hypothetical protein
VAGREYVIPGHEDGYAITVNGPSGWEGLKIVATMNPIELGMHFEGAAKEIQIENQRSFVTRLGTELSRTQAEDWSEGSWAFFIK